MVNPSNDDLGQGKHDPEEGEPSLPRFPHELLNQDNAPPVDREALRRYIRWTFLHEGEPISREEDQLMQQLVATWDNWNQAAEEDLVAIGQLEPVEVAPPVEREAVRRFVRWFHIDHEEQIPDEEGYQVLRLACKWDTWKKAYDEETHALLATADPEVLQEKPGTKDRLDMYREWLSGKSGEDFDMTVRALYEVNKCARRERAKEARETSSRQRNAE